MSSRLRSRCFSLFVLLSVASCAVNQTIVVKADGSGTASLRVEVSKILRDYFASLAELSGDEEAAKNGKVFDLIEIRKGFSDRQGITVTRAASPSPDVLEVDFSYKALKDVFSSDAAIKGAGVATFTEADGKKTLKLHLDKKNYAGLSALFPPLSDPVLAGMGPQSDDTVTEEEYLQMIEFSLGAEGPALLKKSFVTLTIKPEGGIVSQTGGAVSGGAVTFKIPLLSILVLDKPLDYSVTYR
jgi:hypothetical protein